MNCLECQELLQQRLDGAAIAPSPEWDAHLTSCMKCRELHAGAQLLLDGIRKQAAPKLSADFAKRTTAMVLGDRRERRQKIQSRLYFTAALAASVIVMVLFAYAILPRSPVPGPKNNDVLAKDGPGKIEEKPKKKETPPPKVDEKHPERPSAIAALPTRWVDATRDHARVVLAAASFDGLEKLPIDPTATEAAQEMSDGVRTVTLNTRKAFDFFAREFPMPDLADRRE